MPLLRKIIDFTAAHHRQLCIFAGIFLILILLVNVFSGLGTGYIRNWDEARHGISACEMLETGNYIVNTFNYKTDLWNVKPVLAFYGNLCGILLFGKNLFAVRFFSAFAFLLIAVLMFFFLKRTAGPAAAFAGCTAFAVAPTNWVHCFTTGDPDAVFILFIFASFISLWSSLKRGWLLPLAAFFMSLAFLTKSFHAGPYALGALILTAVYWKKFSRLQLLAAFSAGLLPAICWAGVRYYADGPVFFQSMIELDLLGRVKSGTASEHGYSPWYTYLNRLNHFLVIIPVAVIFAADLAGWFFKRKNWMNENYRAVYCWCAGYFTGIILFYSCCRVKLEWYIWPAMPFLAILIGLNFQSAAESLQDSNAASGKNIFQITASGLIVLAFLVWFGIGEGKTLRVIMTRPPQQDILLSQTGGKEYFRHSFFTVDEKGKHFLPEQSFILVMRFLSCKIIPGSLDDFKKSGIPAMLICSFYGTNDEHALQEKALDFARRNDLKFIRCADSLALFRK